MAEYLALPYLSSGLCNTLLQCSPAHALYEQNNRERDDTDASDAGTAIHDALLEGIDRIGIVDAADWRTKAAKEQRDLLRAEGKVPMLAHKVERVKLAVAAAKDFIASSEIADVFDSGKPEQTLIWKEGEILCKARPDWLSENFLLHVKTTQGSAQPESWIRNQLAPSGYDVALAFYERGAIAAGLEDRQHVFLVIEQDAPFGCSLVALAPAMRDLAHRKAKRAIDLWASCQEKKRWPGYPSRIAYAEPKPWEETAEEEAEVRAFDYVGDAL